MKEGGTPVADIEAKRRRWFAQRRECWRTRASTIRDLLVVK